MVDVLVDESLVEVVDVQSAVVIFVTSTGVSDVDVVVEVDLLLLEDDVVEAALVVAEPVGHPSFMFLVFVQPPLARTHYKAC